MGEGLWISVMKEPGLENTEYMTLQLAMDQIQGVAKTISKDQSNQK